MDIRRRVQIGGIKKTSSGGGSTTGGSYTVNLNSQWEATTVVPNPDSTLYDGVYRSSSNYNVNSGASIMYITIKDCSSFKMYIRSYAESNYDYVMVSQLDKTINGNTTYSDTTLVKAHTRGNQQSGTTLSSYTLVEFTGISSGEHTITVVYRKDGSVNNGDDRGYVLIEKTQAGSGDSGGDDEGGSSEGPINTNNYLTIEARENGLTASLSTNACEYCVDGDGNWKTLSAGTATQSINSGQTLSFRGELTPNSSAGIGTFTISKKCNLKGNCMSMLFKDNAANNYSLNGKNYAFYKLFYTCTNIVNVSENFLPATTLASYCYSYMFRDCTSLTTAPKLPATRLTTECYSYMFRDCTSLTTAPKLPATTLATDCYSWMFYGCTSLTTAPTLPATTLSGWCYYFMFDGCTSLTTAPKLPATKLATNCYTCMFCDCTSLTTAPSLPATRLAESCYSTMFGKCTSLTTAPTLPATTLTRECYSWMFYGCTSLTTAPELPATTLAYECYDYMFSGCTSLTTAPKLPATTLETNCYQFMFKDCTSLTKAPTILPATTLEGNCYDSMFYGCTSLTKAPTLPATTLASACYQFMFRDCTKLNYIKMLATDIPDSWCLNNWVTNVASSGTFVKNPAISTGYLRIPSGWTVINDGEEPIDTNNYLTIEALEDGLTASLSHNACEYCVDGDGNWKTLAVGTATESINRGHTLSFRGELTPNTTTFYGIGKFTISKKCNLKGNCMSMLFGDEAADNFSLSGKNYAFYNLFYNCANIVNVSSNFLPATTLADNCYEHMFNYCTNLTTAPELPATTLVDDCYGYMFQGCTSLTAAPELPATTIAYSCCDAMFYNCTSLTTAPELPATTVAAYCYRNMFRGCTSLTTAPELPATSLATHCYDKMFYGCTGLTTAPALPATTLASNCYDSMFYGTNVLPDCSNIDFTSASRGLQGLFAGTKVTDDDLNRILPKNNNGRYYLPATTLADYCYDSMFYGCTGLTTAPELPATKLTKRCYFYMFLGCSNLNYIKMLATDISASECLYHWVNDVASTGTFVKNPAMTTLPTGVSGIPSGWTVVNDGEPIIDINNYLTIEALEDGLTASLSTNACEYCVDGDGNWKSLTAGTATESINTGQILSFRGELTPNSSNGIGTFTINKKCNLKGNCMSMLFADNAADNYSLSGKGWAFYKLFYNCTNIVNVSSNFLPATTLTESCYNGMFLGCTSLTTAPELPATTLTESCYNGMFYNCTNLTTAPSILPATTLADSCYQSMFYGCTSLTTAPELPATTLANWCYQSMFYKCTKLKYIKMLATDVSASNCLYYWVYNVSITGTFVKNPAMTTLPTGTNGIPSGWTVINNGEESGGNLNLVIDYDNLTQNDVDQIINYIISKGWTTDNTVEIELINDSITVIYNNVEYPISWLNVMIGEIGGYSMYLHVNELDEYPYFYINSNTLRISFED